MRRFVPGVAVVLIALLLGVATPTSCLALLLQPMSQPASAPMGEADAVEQQLLARSPSRSGRQWQPNLAQTRLNLALRSTGFGFDRGWARRHSHSKTAPPVAPTLIELRCCLIV